MKTKTSKRNYFNEKEFKINLLKYQETCIIEDNIIIKSDKEIEHYLMKNLTTLAGAVIFNYGYWNYEGEEIDDLKQHALENCFKQLIKFSPEKGSTFNYFTKICRMSLMNYTVRREKHRKHLDIGDSTIEIVDKSQTDFDYFMDNVEENLFKIIDKLDPIYQEKYEKIASIILDYMRKNKNFISKTDLYTHGKNFGVKNSDIRNFVADIQPYKDILFEGIN